jgi:hypothetical protein
VPHEDNFSAPSTVQSLSPHNETRVSCDECDYNLHDSREINRMCSQGDNIHRNGTRQDCSDEHEKALHAFPPLLGRRKGRDFFLMQNAYEAMTTGIMMMSAPDPRAQLVCRLCLLTPHENVNRLFGGDKRVQHACSLASSFASLFPSLQPPEGHLRKIFMSTTTST